MNLLTNFFGINYLRKYNNQILFLQRDELHQNEFSYKKILDEIELIIKCFSQKNIDKGVGFAIFVEELTPANLILLLSILNYESHFLTLKTMHTNATEFAQYLLENGAQFLILPNEKLDLSNAQLISCFNVLKQTYYLYKLNTGVCKTLPKLPKNMCYSIATTGTTGAPKLVHVPYDCIASNVMALSKRLSICATDIIYLGSPHTFDPFVIELFLTLQNGATLFLTDAKTRLMPQKLMRTLFPAQETGLLGVTLLQMTPSLFRRFGVDVIREHIFSVSSSLRVLLLGGEPFPAVSELNSWITQNALNNKMLCNIYGITEQSCWSTIYHYKRTDLAEKLVPIGEPIADETLRIVNAQGETLLGAGEGELWVGSATRRCYIPQTDDCVTKFEDICWRATGDLVRCDDKQNIYHLGRLNSIVKRLGQRICLDTLSIKIWNLLEEFSLQVVCLWSNDRQKLICYIFSTNSINLQKKRKFSKIVQTGLAPHERPDNFIYLSEALLNANGKIDKRRLLKSFNEPLTGEPLDIFESFLINTLAIKLHERVKNSNKRRWHNDLEKSFIDLGGTSFYALTLSTEIGSQLRNAEDQRKLLEMLLNADVTINEILQFLSCIKTIKNNPKNEAFTNFKEISHGENVYFKLEWHVDFKKCIDSGVAQFDSSYICVGSHSKLLQTIDSTNGKIISTITLPDRIECKAEFINSDLALVGCYNGFVYAFHPKTGKIVWQSDLDGMIKAKPLKCLNGECVVIGSYALAHNLTCLEVKTGTVRWRILVGSKAIFAAPIHLKENCILICVLDGIYASVNVHNGSINWLNKCDTPIFSTPVLLPNSKYFALAEVSGAIHVCSVISGLKLSTFQAEGNIFSSILVHVQHENILLLFGCHDQHLYCLKFIETTSENMLSLVFKTHLGAAIYATPILLKFSHVNYIICCTTKGLLVLLRLTDGVIMATHNVQGEIFSTPAIINEHVYFGCRNNFLYCFAIKNS